MWSEQNEVKTLSKMVKSKIKGSWYWIYDDPYHQGIVVKFLHLSNGKSAF